MKRNREKNAIIASRKYLYLSIEKSSSFHAINLNTIRKRMECRNLKLAYFAPRDYCTKWGAIYTKRKGAFAFRSNAIQN